MNNGQSLELHNYDGYYVRDVKVTIEGEPVPDGELQFESLKYQIQNSRISKLFQLIKYDTNRGEIFIEEDMYNNPVKGNLVFQNNKPAPDGKYKLHILSTLTVKDGRVLKTSIWG